MREEEDEDRVDMARIMMGHYFGGGRQRDEAVSQIGRIESPYYVVFVLAEQTSSSASPNVALPLEQLWKTGGGGVSSEEVGRCGKCSLVEATYYSKGW